MTAAVLIGDVILAFGIAAIGLLLYKQRQQLINLREHQKSLHEAIKRGRAHTTKTVDEIARREFRQMEALLSLRDLLDLKAPLAPTRNWAASPDLLLGLAQLIEREQPRVILECGGGTSTVVMASVVRKYGGRVITLEHLPEFRDATRAALETHGLDADVRLAPLTEIPGLTFNGERFRWYDPAALADLPEIDLFFIDGPPEATGRYARFPALPLLWSRASQQVSVVLDDTVREDEQAISDAWSETFDLASEAWPLEKGARVLRRR
jgi:predicted O-methyltransferase YrrM